MLKVVLSVKTSTEYQCNYLLLQHTRSREIKHAKKVAPRTSLEALFLLTCWWDWGGADFKQCKRGMLQKKCSTRSTVESSRQIWPQLQTPAVWICLTSFKHSLHHWKEKWLRCFQGRGSNYLFDSHTHAWKQNQYYYDPRGDQMKKKIGSINTNMLWRNIWIKGNSVTVLKNYLRTDDPS